MSIKAILTLSAVTCLFTLNVAAQGNSGKNKEKDLPPGLQKKVQSGKSLPPGWQKKLKVGEPLEQEVYDYGKVVIKDKDTGLVTINVDGRLIKVVQNTREIVEIIESL